MNLVQATTPTVVKLAGRRWSPWAVVHHRGRKTGRDLAVPVVVMATPTEFVINLPWGPTTNWVRNVQAAGACTITWKGADHRATAPRILSEAEARPYYSRLSWTIARRFFPADAWLLLHRTP
ncbi:nitroreductase [Actinoplanes sp. OR16]|uniref:nitroreductase family deazaflavin-dependent oxidoreductase n=1 Tax=Actinoplanes sp. OR16 TaxID=946334 RepID=UPI000F6BA290|nr:nitroreductase family deazaflavin-dependent oxidoreductase [Actinoplanes sp. OR16]BBH67995.1 nitroreductase [Actinoplanes sp. OR16]